MIAYMANIVGERAICGGRAIVNFPLRAWRPAPVAGVGLFHAVSWRHGSSL
jgi:hypothetical protein